MWYKLHEQILNHISHQKLLTTGIQQTESYIWKQASIYSVIPKYTSALDMAPGTTTFYNLTNVKTLSDMSQEGWNLPVKKAHNFIQIPGLLHKHCCLCFKHLVYDTHNFSVIDYFQIHTFSSSSWHQDYQ